MLDDEMPGPMWIGEITWVLYLGQPGSHSEGFTVSMANTPLDELTEVFEDNYPTGALVQVAVVDSLSTAGPDGTEITVKLETPFYYNGADNLLIETEYSQGSSFAWSWCWNPSSNRGITSYPGDPTGNFQEYVPYMVLESPESLNNETFGGIKVVLGKLQHQSVIFQFSDTFLACAVRDMHQSRNQLY